MNGENWTPPEWVYRNHRPSNDDAYFENMTRVIFTAGLNWNVIDKKWLDFKKVFRNFRVGEVAEFNEKDVERLMANAGIVRNRAKIVATIENAKEFLKIKKECGSFQKYLDDLDKSENYAKVVKELGNKFRRLGPSSTKIFLYTVGEEIRHNDM